VTCIAILVTPDMLRNVSVLEETPTTVTLRATPPSANPHLPFISWMVKYELVSDGFEQHTSSFNFSKCKRHNIIVTATVALVTSLRAK